MVDIVIVNWNSGGQLLDCLNSVSLYSKGLVDKVIVVDNASVDNSIECIVGVDFNFDLIVSMQKVNLGFGAACNIGVSLGMAEYVLFLNPDTKIYHDTLSRSIDFMMSPSGACVGVCGIKLQDEFGKVQKHCARFPSLKTYFGQSTGLNVIFPKKIPYLFMVDFSHEYDLEVDHCIGAYYLIRRSVFDSVGGFDERFFVYLEDLDLSFRVKKLGWKIYYLSSASAFHKGGGTSENVKAHRLFYSLRSRIMYVFKHFSFSSAFLVMIMAMFLEIFPRVAQNLIFKRSWSAAKDTMKAFFMLWKDSPNFIRLIFSK